MNAILRSRALRYGAAAAILYLLGLTIYVLLG